MLQFPVCVGFPEHVPLIFSTTDFVLSLICVPPPHVLEHSDHDCQVAHVQSTVKMQKNRFVVLYVDSILFSSLKKDKMIIRRYLDIQLIDIQQIVRLCLQGRPVEYLVSKSELEFCVLLHMTYLPLYLHKCSNPSKGHRFSRIGLTKCKSAVFVVNFKTRNLLHEIIIKLTFF